MQVSPLDLEQAPRSRVFEWLYFRRELGLFQEYKAEEASWRASRQVN
jgi:hypothetical protein